MEIQYLKSLEQFDTIDGLKIEGVSEVEIEQAENKFNINFPKAYKEFLLLAGELNNGLFGNGFSSSLDWAVEYFQQDAADELAKKM